MLRRVDSVFESERGFWIGLTARRRVLVYNEELVSEDELPRSVFDVVEPEYRGRVGVAPENASFQDFVSAMRQVEGDERTSDWLRGLADNDAPTYANNNAIVEAVGRGEIPMGSSTTTTTTASSPRIPACRAATTSSPTATSARCCSRRR